MRTPNGSNIATGPGSEPSGLVFNIMRFSLHDGPGIRTTVFLKGCPLHCRWCHNPESRDFRPELMFLEDRCRRCGDCVTACPQHAIPFAGAAVPENCTACGTCAEACLAGARQLAGRPITVSAALAEIEKDRVFFDESGGGVTLSGGEPLAQAGFAGELLARCRARGIHTAVDTCGFADRATLLRVAAHADLVLYDLKVMDEARHREFTGVSNEQILSNFEALTAAGVEVVARMPLTPGVNDDPAALSALAEFVTRAGVRRLDLLPYHCLGRDKYRRLNAQWRMEGVPEPAPDEVERAAARLRREGIDVRIGG